MKRESILIDVEITRLHSPMYPRAATFRMGSLGEHNAIFIARLACRAQAVQRRNEAVNVLFSSTAGNVPR